MELKHISHAIGIFLLLAGLITRLVSLSYPPQVIFDEVHFGKFVTAYCCTHERFFDIHPPHAKLLTAGIAWMGGYRGGFSFENIGQDYGATPIVPLRTTAALAGAILPLLVYVLLRQAGVSVEISFLGGAAILLDNAFVLQSRVIALDTVLLATTFGSLICWLSAESRQGKQQLWYLVGSGILAGIALGTKFTGLSALAMLGVLTLIHMITGRSVQNAFSWAKRGLLVLGVASVVYAGGWVLHYTLLTQPGSGDVWQIPTGNMVEDIVSMHKIMFNANYNLTATHPYSSKWWTWPIMQRPVFYWQGQEGAKLYLLGNPVVWWGASILFLCGVIWQTLQFFARGKIEWGKEWIFLLGYVIAFAPFIRVPRALFLYHYMTPLIFSLLFGLTWFHNKMKDSSYSWQQWIPVTMAVIIVGFVLFSPLTYGFPQADWLALLYWFPSWR